MANGGPKWPKWGGGNPDEPPRDFMERLLTDPRTLFLTLGIVVTAWLASGIYFVDEGAVGVVRRFGKETGRTSPGINYHLPWPVDAVDIVRLDLIRRAEVGFQTAPGAYQQSRRRSAESLMLTGDENIVDAQMIVQFKIKDPSQYLFRLRDPEQSLKVASEVALRSIAGQTTIDDILTVGRAQVQIDTLAFLQKLMDDYQSGILVTEVKLQVVDPPEQVKDAFHEVVRAREDRERLINKALGYQEDLIPRARGEAQKILREAEAYKEERVLKARGDAARFLALYEEYQKAKQVTRDRLYLETLERILPKADKLVVDSKVNTMILPFLPLGTKRVIEAEMAQPQSHDMNQPASAPGQTSSFRRVG